MIEYEEGRFNIVKKITYPWQTMRKNNSELLNCFVFVFVFFNFFGVELFSGQDEVRTSQPATLVVGLSAFRSHAPTTQPSRRLKVNQLVVIQH